MYMLCYVYVESRSLIINNIGKYVFEDNTGLVVKITDSYIG